MKAVGGTRVAWLGGLMAFGLLAAPAASPADEPATVVSVGFRYVLPDTTIPAKGSLLLRNLDASPHNVTALSNARNGAPLFTSETIGATEATPVKGVEKLAPGVYDYTCSVHPSMFGTLTVE